MKKKLIIGIFVFALIGFNVSINKAKKGMISLNDLIQMNSSEAECRPNSFWYSYPPCNQRYESIPQNCDMHVTVRTYTTANGSFCGTAWIEAGVIKMKSGYSTSYYSDYQSHQVFTATRVNCPTDNPDNGHNDCVEYRPCN